MSLFKYKPPKKIILDERSIITLDSKHKELQTEFQYIQDRLTIVPAQIAMDTATATATAMKLLNINHLLKSVLKFATELKK
jgi:hypothetical protein